MPLIRKIDRTRAKKEDRKEASLPESKNDSDVLSTNDAKKAAKQDQVGINGSNDNTEGLDSFGDDAEKRDLVDSADDELLPTTSPVKSKAKKKGRKNARKKPPVKNLKKVVRKPKQAPSKREADEDSFDSADDQISDESRDDSKDEDFDEHAMDDEEEDNSSDAFIASSDEDVAPKRKGKRRLSRSKPQSSRRSARAKARKSDASSSEDEFVPKQKQARRRSKGITPRWDESSSEEDILPQDVSVKKRARRKSALKALASRARKSRIQADLDGGSEESYSGDDGGPGLAPKLSPRASARKASAKLSLYAEDSYVEDDENLSPKKSRQEDTEEFVLDNEAEEDSDEDLSGAVEASDEVGNENADVGSADEESSDDKKAAYVDGEDIGTADDSGSEEEDAEYGSPQLKLKRLPTESPKKANRLYEDSDSSESSSQKILDTSPPEMPSCDSVVDVITDEPLPDIHVCYFPPDGQTRQCFALDTLRKVALTTANPKFRQTLSGEELTFLQPPHFRTEMSDELLDQIASRFGRSALDINGPYYTGDVHRPAAAGGFRPVSGSTEEGDERFMMRVRKYAQGVMGNQDLYVCPLCYTVAHQRLSEHNRKKWRARGSRAKRGSEEDDSEDEDDKLAKKYSLDFSYDPMSILESLDGAECEIASFFCFKRASEVKVHLRNDHEVDTRIVQGNDLYSRFKIREQDGLLQRYIKKECGFGVSKQGYLQQYWFGGSNFSFVHLLSLIRQAARCRELVETQEAYLDAVTTTDKFGRTKIVERRLKREDAEERFQPAFDFFSSFADLAPKLWELIAGPYSQDKQDIKDFIEDNEVEDDGETGAVYRAAEMQAFRESLESDQQHVEYLQSQEADYLKNREGEEEAASEKSDGLMDSTQSDGVVGPEDDVANGGYFEESSSEEDDWMQKKRESLDSRRRQSRGRGGERRRSAKLKEDKSDEDSESEVEFETKTADPSKSRSGRAIDDSDDERA